MKLICDPDWTFLGVIALDCCYNLLLDQSYVRINDRPLTLELGTDSTDRA